jgi:probable O-glycosylation ligase (exosortase A-associated)
MSLRDLTVTAVIVLLLPVAFLRPWIGVLVWSWIGYMNPHRLTWGFARTMPFAQWVALATLAGLLFTKDRKPLPRRPEVYLLVALWALFTVTTFMAAQQADAWEQFDKVSKILLVTFVTLLLFQDESRLRHLLYVIALSIGFYGLKGGIWAVATGGGNQVLGPPATFIAGNTEIGLAMNMVLPLLLLLSRHEKRWWIKRGLQVTFGFTIVAVLITYSRGALLGLLIVVPLIVLRTRARFLVLPLAFAGYIFAQPLAQAIMPERWLDRMGTISEYEQDLSARMRLNSWYTAWRIGLDHPFFGRGFRPFTLEIYLRYSPDEQLNTTQDAHSIYFQVLAEHGFLGLGLYVALILSTLLSLRGTMRQARGKPHLAFIGDAARMLQVSVIAYCTTGAFLSMSYFDLFYHLVAIAAILRVLARQPASEPAPAALQVRTSRIPGRLPVPRGASGLRARPQER